MRRRVLAVGTVVSVLCLAALPVWAYQYKLQNRVATGSVLIANEKLNDPNFNESVILIVQYDVGEGAAGLVLNRRSDVPLARVFPAIKTAARDLVYLGGPVGMNMAQALLRLSAKTEHATHVVDDVYVSGSKELIEKSVAAHTQPSKFHLYLGYAGWGPGQLEAEIKLGAWTVISAVPRMIFDEDPDSLWQRLIHESQMQVAGRLPLSNAEIVDTHARKNGRFAEVARREHGFEIFALPQTNLRDNHRSGDSGLYAEAFSAEASIRRSEK